MTAAGFYACALDATGSSKTPELHRVDLPHSLVAFILADAPAGPLDL